MKSIEKKIKEFFRGLPDIIAVYLYGSMVTGRIHSESDIDIAVLFDRKGIPTSVQLLDLQTDLAEILKMEVDLVCLNEVSPILQRQVISKGKQMVVNNQHQLNQFIIRSYTDYVDMKIVREPIEKYFVNRRILNGR